MALRAGSASNTLPHFRHGRAHQIDDLQSARSAGYFQAFQLLNDVLAVPMIANEDDGFQIRHHRSRDPDRIGERRL